MAPLSAHLARSRAASLSTSRLHSPRASSPVQLRSLSGAVSPALPLVRSDGAPDATLVAALGLEREVPRAELHREGRGPMLGAGVAGGMAGGDAAAAAEAKESREVRERDSQVSFGSAW